MKQNNSSKRSKYTPGAVINGVWVIVAILETRKQNKKLLCYNLKTDTFTEGWIWDFTRDLISPNKISRLITCRVIHVNPSIDLEVALDYNHRYAWEVARKSPYLITTENRKVLQGIREGYLPRAKVNELLNKFDNLLSNSGQQRRNINLAILISTTYQILKWRNYFVKKEN